MKKGKKRKSEASTSKNAKDDFAADPLVHREISRVAAEVLKKKTTLTAKEKEDEEIDRMLDYVPIPSPRIESKASGSKKSPSYVNQIEEDIQKVVQRQSTRNMKPPPVPTKKRTLRKASEVKKAQTSGIQILDKEDEDKEQ